MKKKTLNGDLFSSVRMFEGVIVKLTKTTQSEIDASCALIKHDVNQLLPSDKMYVSQQYLVCNLLYSA